MFSSLSQNRWTVVLAGLSILVATVIAYQPVMFNFFTADDFYNISWYHDTRNNPILFLTQSIQHLVEPSQYYRPVINAVMYGEYLLWGANGCPFRVTSLFFQFLSLITLCVLITEIARDSQDQVLIEAKKYWCYFSVALFAVYPLHTEPVNWIISQTEIIASLFVLLSFWFYVRWRNHKSWYLEAASCVLAAGAFFTKEATVALPVILVSYEMLVRQCNNSLELKGMTGEHWVLRLLTRCMRSVIPTLGHWVTLGCYFYVRKLVLGDFIGSWKSEGGFYYPDIPSMLLGWQQSIKMILVPLPQSISTPFYLAHNVWVLIVGGLAFLSISSAWGKPRRVLLLAFMLAWAIISVAPAYSLLLITPDLLNARYGYSATISLCMFLGFGLATNAYLKSRPLRRNALFICILGFSCLLLRTNNLAWAEAGHMTNNMVAEFRRVHLGVKGDPRMYILNIPMRFKGVPIVGIDFVGTSNRQPFAERNFGNCQSLRNSDQTLPIGLLEKLIESGNIGATFYIWNMADQHLHQVNFSKLQKRLPGTLHVGGIPNNQMMSLPKTIDLGTPSIKAGKKAVLSFAPKKLNCWTTDFIALDVSMQHTGRPNKLSLVELSYANDIKDGSDVLDQVVTRLDPGQSEQTLVFTLRGNPDWAFGGLCQKIKVEFPKGYIVHLNTASAINDETLIPKIQAISSNYCAQLGQFTMSEKCKECVFRYDTNHIKDCAGVSVEAIGPSARFTELNSPQSDTHSLIQLVVPHPRGSIKLEYSMFPGKGTYKVRLRPIDGRGAQKGLCSDHFMVVVT